MNDIVVTGELISDFSTDELYEKVKQSEAMLGAFIGHLMDIDPEFTEYRAMGLIGKLRELESLNREIIRRDPDGPDHRANAWLFGDTNHSLKVNIGNVREMLRSYGKNA